MSGRRSPASASLSPTFKLSTPRVRRRFGAACSLGKDRKTLLRASYSRFADQLGAGFTAFTDPLAAQSYEYFYSTNTGNGTILPSQIVPGSLGFSGNVSLVGGISQG